MARKQYGITWWGEKWLSAFTNIDHSNRIPRGKTYANTGKVKQLAIGEKITATVQGSLPSPYRQQLALTPFTEEQKEIILDVIEQNAFLLSKLMSREVPVELFEILKGKGIHLFPQSWNTFRSASCSCPDSAMPCKHLAAVIYLVIEAIDQNPFLTFSLRGLDLIKALKERGIREGAEALPIVKLSELFAKKTQKKVKEELAAFSFDEDAWNAIDFAALSPTSVKLLALLDDKPLFDSTRNFKEVYAKEVQQIGESARTLFEDINASEENPSEIYADTDEITVVLTAEGAFESAGEFFSFDEFIDELGLIPWAELSDYPDTVRALYMFRTAAFFLWKNEAVLPQLVQISKTRYQIRWVPAALLGEVQVLMRQLDAILPPHTLVLQENSRAWRYPSEHTDQTTELLSVFLTELCGILYIPTYSMENHFNPVVAPNSSLPRKRGRRPREAPVELSKTTKVVSNTTNIFFAQEPIDTTLWHQRETSQSIQKWLQKFSLGQRLFAPLLRIEENEQGDFLLSLWVEDRQDVLKEPVALQAFLGQKKKEDDVHRGNLLRDVALLSGYLPDVAALLNDKATGLRLSPKSFAPILTDVLPVLQLLGIRVLLPKSLERMMRPRLTASITATGSVGANASFIDLGAMLDFSWTVAIGDEHLSPEEFLKLVRKTKGVVKVKNEYVFLDEKEIASILHKIAQEGARLDKRKVLQAALSEELGGSPVQLDEAAQQLIQYLLSAPEIPMPSLLNATFRPYQQRGYEWLYKNALLGIGSLLADDMGLGKTLQTIALIAKFKEEGRLEGKQVLVVGPTTLLTNWQREFEKFAPSLRSHVYHGAGRALDDTADVVLTSYGLARGDVQVLSQKVWALLVIDEAQNIKNPQAKQTKSVKSIQAETVVALSGTPVENRLSEYWSILDFTNSGYLSSLNRFTEEFSQPIELHRDHAALERFRKITSPFILRRLKTDKSIINDLPDKVEMNQICHLSPQQTALYQNVVNAALNSIAGTENTFSRQGLVLQMITHLKQICNHPSQYLKRKDISPTLSGKATTLLEIVGNILDVGEKVLIFTQYKEMGDLLSVMLTDELHHEPLWLHGGTTLKKRNQMIETFQHRPYPKIMLLSLKAAGTGLNLTEANHVIHYDLWWNPAVEAQATDRAFRIGQKKNVMVHRFITQGTFEEKINQMIESKRELADLAVATGETWIGNLSNQELDNIFKLG